MWSGGSSSRCISRPRAGAPSADRCCCNADPAQQQQQPQHQNTALNPLQRARDGRWVCPFCNAHLSTKGSLATHVQSKHEGSSRCRGETMKDYLQYMNRWLCGSCYYSVSCRYKKCPRDKEPIESGIPGEAPAGPTFRWTKPEGEPAANTTTGKRQ